MYCHLTELNNQADVLSMWSYDFRVKRCSVRLYLQFSYLRYLRLFAYSSVQHILLYIDLVSICHNHKNILTDFVTDLI
jgi:hypothetical protein